MYRGGRETAVYGSGRGVTAKRRLRSQRNIGLVIGSERGTVAEERAVQEGR